METTMIPKVGSIWTGNSREKLFRVISTIELDGHTWVHYCDDDNGENKYSCYLESFLHRFKEILNS
jgi:hypothetical protein